VALLSAEGSILTTTALLGGQPSAGRYGLNEVPAPAPAIRDWTPVFLATYKEIHHASDRACREQYNLLLRAVLAVWPNDGEVLLGGASVKVAPASRALKCMRTFRARAL